MKQKAKSFQEALPLEIHQLCEFILLKGYKLGFVGGVVRDFLLKQVISYDIDIEIRPLNKSFDINSLFNSLKESYKVSLNKEFSIITLDLENYSLELGFPRIETYTNELSHKNFSIEFCLDYDEAFKRRDFTINAMMFEFDGKWRFIDPLNGELALKEKRLVPCSESFSKDPVRQLRALRFEMLLGFKFEGELDIELALKSGSYYLAKEALKSKRPLSFLSSLGVLKGYKEDSYDSNSYSLDISIGRSQSIENKLDALKLLGLGQKNILFAPQSKESLRVNFDLYKHLKKQKLTLKEIQSYLDFHEVVYEGIDLKILFFSTTQNDLEAIPVKERAFEVFKQRINEASDD